MSPLLQLGIYAVLLGGLAFGGHLAWDGFKHSIAAPYVAAQIAHDQPLIDGANKRAGDADLRAGESDRRASNAQADTAACVAAQKPLTDQVEMWKRTAAGNKAQAQSAKAAGAADAAKRRVQVEYYRGIATGPPVHDETCQRALSELDKMLRDAAKAKAGVK